MKVCTELQPVDLRLIEEKLAGFLPEQIFDFHAHLLNPAHCPPDKCPAGFDPKMIHGLEAHFAAMQRWLPGRKVEGLFFGLPNKLIDRSAANDWITSQISSHAQSGNSRCLALVSPQDNTESLRNAMAQKKFAGLKPYHVYAGIPDTMQATIEEYAPPWMWELCHEFQGVLMLHIVRDRGIADEKNISSLQTLCRKYPRCRVILAHVARSFCYRHAIEGLAAVAELENVFIDTSVVNEAEAMRQAIKILGPERVLYGSDFPVSEWRGKCLTMGDGFAWIYADNLPAGAVSQIGNFTLIGIESLLCLREACLSRGSTTQEVEAIFLHNAQRILGF